MLNPTDSSTTHPADYAPPDTKIAKITGFCAPASGFSQLARMLRIPLVSEHSVNEQTQTRENPQMAIHKDKDHAALPADNYRDLAGEVLRRHRDAPDPGVEGRTRQLTRANLRLTQEIDERRKAEGSLQGAYAEIKRWKDRLQNENIYLQQELAREYNFGEIIGQSDVMLQLTQRVEQVAALHASVLLRGEAGTGKGVVARAIHNLSDRRDRPMITVNLAALPAHMIESELFGWERGELTGADARQVGRFELADAGTIFLEEIDEMPLELQGRLLRLIRDGELERLGSPRTIRVDVRIIAASSHDLEQAVASGRFLEDLFSRLKIFPLTIPPLSLRKEDIPLLVDHFIAKYNERTGAKVTAVSNDTLSALQGYGWPGNVRELESVVERALITSGGSELRLGVGDAGPGAPGEVAGEHEILALADLEHDHILHVLLKTGWRIEGEHGAAVLLGLNPSTLRARMRKYGILRQYVQTL
jgi:formate hydrogenlyase transcriptional activator